jgi:hypothetical protein
MNDQIIQNPEALRLFFNEDVYLVKGSELSFEQASVAGAESVAKAVMPVISIDHLKVAAIEMPLEAPGVLEGQSVVSRTFKEEHPQEKFGSGEETDKMPLDSTSTMKVISVQKQEPTAIQEDVIDRQISTEDDLPLSFDFTFKGNNQKKVLILVNDPDHEVSTAVGTEILRNLVTAIKLKSDHFALVNYANYSGARYKHLQEFFSSQVMLLFGVTAAELGLNEQLKNIIVAQGQTKLIFASNLDQINSDPQGKKLLWTSLQQLSL